MRDIPTTIRVLGRSLLAVLLLGATALGSAASADTHAAAPAKHAALDKPSRPDSGGLLSDFNGDGYDDLAISDFGFEVDGVISAGAASVIYGSASGLNKFGNQLWTENSPGMGTVAES